MQELYIQDELVDYNDDPDTPPESNSPVQSPLALHSETEEGDERMLSQEEEAARKAIEQEQERKAVEDAATKRREAHMKEVEILVTTTPVLYHVL